MRKTVHTRWLLAQVCPVCEQRSVMHLVECPECDSLGAICDEDGAGYLDARDISGATTVDFIRCDFNSTLYILDIESTRW